MDVGQQKILGCVPDRANLYMELFWMILKKCSISNRNKYRFIHTNYKQIIKKIFKLNFSSLKIIKIIILKMCKEETFWNF